MRIKFCFLAALMLASPSVAASERTDSIDSYKVVMTADPVKTPTNYTVDAPVAGNGDIGLTMCNSADHVRCYIGKNDFWKPYEPYPYGGIAFPGWLDLSSREICLGERRMEELPGSACINASYKTAENCLSIKAWVAATDNVIVLDVTTLTPTVLEFSLKPCEDNGSAVMTGESDDSAWAVREFKGNEKLCWESGVAMALNCSEGRLEITPGRHVFAVGVYSNFDAEDFKAQALNRVSGFDEAAADALWKDHVAWWESFWNLSHVEIGDEFLEKYYYISQYLFASASRAGKFAPGIWGPYITTDFTDWAGDYHLNYNYQGPYWACYSSNQLTLVENYDKPVLDFMERGRELSSTLVNCRGVYYPVGIGPLGMSTCGWPDNEEEMEREYGSRDIHHDGGMMFFGQRSNASFCAINMLMRFYATWDKSYAEEVYPFIKACADFWEDWLVLENGRYVDMNDDFHEESCLDGHKGDLNPVCSLGLIRMVMQGADDISSFLRVDKSCRKTWKDILNRLSDYPTWTTPDGRVTLIDSESCGDNGERTLHDYRIGLNRVMMHGMLIPHGVSGPHLTPELNAIMLSDVAQWKNRRSNSCDWGNSLSNGIETVYAGAARIGYPAEEILTYLKERIEMKTLANGYIEADGGGVETLAAVPFTINEMLLQSFEGTVRVFPNWVKDKDASFETLRADGAFLVSSSLKNGVVEQVTIVSEQGRPLFFENPWPGSKVSVSRNGRRARTYSGEVLKIKTKPGQTLQISRK